MLQAILVIHLLHVILVIHLLHKLCKTVFLFVNNKFIIFYNESNHLLFILVDTTSHYRPIVEGLKNCLAQNKEMFQAICEIKNEQKVFYKEIRERFDEISNKVDQLMIPENSYWKVRLNNF